MSVDYVEAACALVHGLTRSRCVWGIVCGAGTASVDNPSDKPINGLGPHRCLTHSRKKTACMNHIADRTVRGVNETNLFVKAS